MTTRLEAFLIQADQELATALAENAADPRTFDCDLTTFTCEACGVEAVNNYEGWCGKCFTA